MLPTRTAPPSRSRRKKSIFCTDIRGKNQSVSQVKLIDFSHQHETTPIGRKAMPEDRTQLAWFVFRFSFL